MDILASGVSAWLCIPPWCFSWGLDCSSACEFQLAVFPALGLLLNIPAIQSNRFRVAEVPGYTALSFRKGSSAPSAQPYVTDNVTEAEPWEEKPFAGTQDDISTLP